jgi:hypothetical protein
LIDGGLTGGTETLPPILGLALAVLMVAAVASITIVKWCSRIFMDGFLSKARRGRFACGFSDRVGWDPLFQSDDMVRHEFFLEFGR